MFAVLIVNYFHSKNPINLYFELPHHFEDCKKVLRRQNVDFLFHICHVPVVISLVIYLPTFAVICSSYIRFSICSTKLMADQH
jgi:hypothetical protein